MAYKRIVLLTGAGISAESGIRTFRDAGGLWENHRLEDVATPEAFARDPELVQRFYNLRRQQLKDPDIKPNAAHAALARLEQQFDGDVLLVTQNVDNLHERAGSQNLIHMHGELVKSHCEICNKVYPQEDDLAVQNQCGNCGGRNCLRPHIVWFGEMPLEMDRIYDELARCDLFASIGTSGNVYPAAGFVSEANRAGATTLSLNLEPPNGSDLFQHHRYGPATETVPAWVDEILSGNR